jgi:tetratricopeptide (TPR) repeat protein
MKTSLTSITRVSFLAIFFSFQFARSSAYSPATDSVQLFLSNYQYSKALNLIERELKQTGESKYLYNLKGNAYKGLYQFSQAIDAYKKVLAYDTTNIRTIIDIAHTYKQIPDNENAMKYYALASSYDTSNLAFKMEIANCKFSMDFCSEALNDYRPIYHSDTSNLFLIKRMAMCYYKNMEVDSAINFYYKALFYNAYDATSVANICNLLFLKKGYEEGIKLTEAYRQIDSANAKVNSLNAYMYLLSEKYRKAVNRFQMCYDNKDSSKFILKNLGIAYYRTESYDTAKFYLEKAYNSDTLEVTTAHFLGMACTKSYYKQLGIMYLEKAIHLYDPTIEKLANLYMNTSEACDAWGKCPAEKKLSINQKARYYNPKEKKLILKLASIYDYHLKDSILAVDYYREFLNSMPDEEKISQKNGIIKNINGRIEKLQKK